MFLVGNERQYLILNLSHYVLIYYTALNFLHIEL